MITEQDILDPSTKARCRRWTRRIINTQYFFTAVLLHILFLLLWGSWVVLEKFEPKGTIIADGGLFIKNPQSHAIAPPPAPPQEIKEMEKEIREKTSSSRSVEQKIPRITVGTPKPSFSIPDSPPSFGPDLEIKSDENLAKKFAEGEKNRIKNIRTFIKNAINNGAGPLNFGNKKNLIARFSCYVGKYDGGDWNCNYGFVADRRWHQNCINNLMLQIKRWTKNNVNAELLPESLDLGSREWIENIHPPFVFITGHQDFSLNENESQNLRDYLMMGGLMWIDNSLPGRRSRFDLAVRREMKKVFPDRDFEAIGNNHPLYDAYFHFTAGAPAGMNFYREPIEIIKVGAGEGDAAVIYTLNAYSDLWETALTDKDKVDVQYDFSHERNQWIGRYGPHWQPYTWSWERQFFYRNYSEKSIHESYKLGINIVFYLLTRFQDKFMKLPGGVL
ncbi:MAG: DUF4159 domain-containing protein [Verrucomicrobiae bacterium]|nr:DUF4159 domain-containing protein [Verrucomicrobiae bacterium]